MFRKVLLTLTILCLCVVSTTTANAKSTYKRISVTKVRSQTFHNAKNTGAVYNRTHSKRLFYLRKHPHTTWHVTYQETLRYHGKNAVYYYVKSGNKNMPVGYGDTTCKKEQPLFG